MIRSRFGFSDPQVSSVLLNSCGPWRLPQAIQCFAAVMLLPLIAAPVTDRRRPGDQETRSKFGSSDPQVSPVLLNSCNPWQLRQAIQFFAAVMLLPLIAAPVTDRRRPGDH